MLFLSFNNNDFKQKNPFETCFTMKRIPIEKKQMAISKAFCSGNDSNDNNNGLKKFACLTMMC